MDPRRQSLVIDVFIPKKSWVPDNQATLCFSCGSCFSFVNRRHHCRMCGNLFDRKCANYYLSPPLFVFGREKKIRVCSSCFEKSNFLMQEKRNRRLDRQKSLQHLDPTKRAEIDGFLTLFLTDKFYEQADNILEYCLRQNDLYDDWFEVLKSLVKDSIEMVKPKVVENSRYNINDFVKIKKLSATEPTSELIRGIIIRKNVANKKMSSSLEYPTILMVKGSLEPYNVNEVSILDVTSNQSEATYIKNLADNIKKLNPMIIIVEGTVNRGVQEMILKANKVLVMKLRTVQFRKLARYIGAKPVQCNNSLHHASTDMLGRCSRFFVDKLVRPESASEGLSNKEKKDLLEPSLMYFDGCDTTRGVTINISGPDPQKLRKVKRCLKEVLVLVKNLYFERGVIYQDIVLYHMKERLWRMVNSSESPSYRKLIKQDIRKDLAVDNNPDFHDEVFQNVPVSCIVNRNTIFSAGFMSHYLTEKISLQKVIENKSLKFTRIVLIPMNINSFPDLLNKGINIQTELLPELKNTNCLHTDEVCQLEKDPTPMDVGFYGKDDASLGIYLINKAARVFETCVDCNRSYYYHTTMFFIKKYHIKVTLELKNQAKLKQIVNTSKKMKESSRRQTMVPQAKEGFMDFLAKVAPPPQRTQMSESFVSECSMNGRPAVMNSCYTQMTEERVGTAIDVIMYLECSQCKTRLSELVKLKQEFLDYSLTRFLESLVFAAEQYQDPNMLYPESLVLKNVSKSAIRACCQNSFKNRVFMVEDLFIRFKLGFSNPLNLSELKLSSEESRRFVKDQNKELLDSKQEELSKAVEEYMSMTIANIQEAILSLAEKSNIHLNLDTLHVIEGLLTCSDDATIRNPSNFLLLGLYAVYKEFEIVKDEIQADLNKKFKHHLEIDVQRKTIFNRLMKLFSNLEKVRREYIRTTKDQNALNQSENNQTRTRQTMEPSMAESGKSIAEEQQLMIVEPDSARSARSRFSTYDECMMRKPVNKVSQTEQERSSEESKDKEIAFFEKLTKGLATDVPLEKGSKKFEMLPINEEEILSLLAYAMNSANYMDEIYSAEGFLSVDEEESKVEEALSEFLAKKVLQMDENTLKQFQLKIPNLEIKMKYFNRLLQGLVDSKKDETQIKDKKSGQSDPIQNLTLFGESFEITRKKSRSIQQKHVVSKTTVTAHYPVHFEVLRLYNGIKLEDYIDSMSTSQDWNNSGGKTGAKFIKTFDQRFVFKQLEKKEFTMLLGFVGDYFKYMFKACQEQQPTLLSKIYGIYEVQDEKQSPLYFIAMENLFFGMEKKIKVFDLKGSELRRYSGKNSGEGHTLLDTDYKIERNGEPMPLRSGYYNYMEKAIKNDTDLLANLKVVDYSMLLILDESKSLVRLGIIDYLRIYDFEKQLEHVSKKLIKGATPTIVSPDSYKERFQKAMKRYFMPIYSDDA